MGGALGAGWSFALGVSGFIALLVGLNYYFLARRRGDWDSSSTFVFLIGTLYNLPTTLAALTGARITLINHDGDSVIQQAAWVDNLTGVIFRIMLGIAALFVFYAAPRSSAGRRAATPMLALALVVWALTTTFLHRGGSLLNSGALLLGVAFVAAVLLPRGRGPMLGAALVTVSQAAGTGILLIASPGSASVACPLTKCGPLGALVVGAFGNENGLGLFLCAGLPFVWLAIRGRTGFWLTLFVTVVIVATGSRSATVSALIIFAALILFRPDLESAPRRRPFVPFVALLAGFAATVVVPLRNTDPTAYTGRGYLWQLALDRFKGGDHFGLGVYAWRAQEGEGTLVHAADYSAHNQALDVLFVGGLVGAVLAVALLASFFRPLDRHRALLASVVLMPVAWAGVTERLWGVGGMDWLSYAYVAAVMALPLTLGVPGDEPVSGKGATLPLPAAAGPR